MEAYPVGSKIDYGDKKTIDQLAKGFPKMTNTNFITALQLANHKGKENIENFKKWKNFLAKAELEMARRLENFTVEEVVEGAYQLALAGYGSRKYASVNQAFR